jgi:hypothetical protein
MSSRTFVIGDVHGKLDNLIALLDRAGVRSDDTVVQLGDLGTYTAATLVEDLAVWQWALRQENLIVLCGNHEAGVLSAFHQFRGYVPPLPDTRHAMMRVGLKWAVAHHGVLLTHAGLHPLHVPAVGVNTVEQAAEYIRKTCSQAWHHEVHLRDDISPRRGGNAPAGGILWRGEQEPIAPFLQVFGHTRDYDIRVRDSGMCIDVNSKEGKNLAGIWLPEMRVVAVGEDAAYLERSLGEQ